MIGRLKRDKTIRKIIVTAQAYYHEHHPEIIFDIIPWCIEKATVVVGRRSRCPGAVYKLKVEIL